MNMRYFRHLHRACKLLTLSALTLFTSFAVADHLSAPSGDVLLTVSGNIQHTNVGDEAHWDLAMLEALPVTSITTRTPWDEGVLTFEGVRINDLLDAMGAGSDRFMALAADEYEVEVGEMDFEQYPIIIAYKQDGNYISLRQLGPLRIMLPFDDHPELDTQNNLTMSVWQLIVMDIL